MVSHPDFDSLGTRLGKLGAVVEENADRTVRKAVLAVDQTVVMATPVDRGRARSNWIAALDAPVTEPREAYQPGEDLGLGEAANAQAAMDQAAGIAAQYDGSRNSEVHITNNLPYIGALNNGHSAQAPADFVQEAVTKGVAAVRGARLLKE